MRTFASVLRTGVTLSLVASLGAATAAAATVTPGNAPEGAGPPAKVKAEAAPASTKEHPAATPKATPLGPAKNDAA